MRLICPNCDAEYEVDASVIPDAGRDVQCSNCGHAWFQASPQVEAELDAEADLYDAPAPETPQTRPEPNPRTLDESVLAVLREEAERETAARRAEAPAIETQPDLGLSQPAPTMPGGGGDPVAQRIAKIKGIEAEPAKQQTRREMLPEIDEINSTLRASSEKRSGDAQTGDETPGPRQRRGAFRNGFLLMMIVAVLIVMLYVMAPKLAQQIPGADPALKAYVGAVDAARIALDGWMQSAIGFLRGLTGKS